MALPKSYLPAFLWMSLDRTIVQAPRIPHFKSLGMRNLQYEISIYQKLIIKPRWQCQVTLIFSESHIVRANGLVSGRHACTSSIPQM